MRARLWHGRRSCWAGITAIVLMLCLGAALAGCDGPPLGGFTRLVPTSTPTATPTAGIQPTISPAPNILPAFSGWRALYLHSDGHLHAISLSDHSDLVGMVAPGLEEETISGLVSAGVSPDGHAIAYATSVNTQTQPHGTLTVFDLARQRVVTYRDLAPVRLIWSPDSAHLAVEMGPGTADVVRLFDRATAKLTDITPAGPTNPAVLGWRADGALILQTADLDFTMLTLWAEDIQTKAAHQITQIPINSQSFTITIAPNGAACVLYTWRFQSNPFTPLVETIDLTTGAIHPLPNITRTTGANFDNLLATWRADGAQVVLARQGLSSQPGPAWMLDLARDTATQVTNGVSPVGWAPDGSGLIFSTTEVATLGDPSHELSLLPLPVTSSTTPTRLTDSAAVFPLLGFVRGD